ncbi:hypothetical protein [Spirochaeta cellobiosiphila]|uniref:hypothetical protein n=1 Tax=Spirochaeta cellobiosiphila TaxID=504483 RepID=UPI0003FC3495|nr:hypothetical protein [Spirochaeta cellobiosiphila]
MKITTFIALFAFFPMIILAQEGPKRLGVLLDYEGEGFLLVRQGKSQEYDFTEDQTGTEFLEGDFISTREETTLLIQLEGNYKVLNVYENTSLTFFVNPANEEPDINMVYGKVDMELTNAGQARIGDFDISTSQDSAKVEYKIVVNPETGKQEESLTSIGGTVDVTSVETGEVSALTDGEGKVAVAEQGKDVKEFVNTGKTPEPAPEPVQPPQEISPAPSVADKTEPKDSGGLLGQYLPGLAGLKHVSLETGVGLYTLVPDNDGSKEGQFLSTLVSLLALRLGGTVHIAYKPVKNWGIGLETGYYQGSTVESGESSSTSYSIPVQLTMPMSYGPLFIQPQAGIDIWGASSSGNSSATTYATVFTKAGLKFSTFSLFLDYGYLIPKDSLTNFGDYIPRIGLGFYINAGQLIGLSE